MTFHTTRHFSGAKLVMRGTTRWRLQTLRFSEPRVFELLSFDNSVIRRYIYAKRTVVEVSKNLARYRYENNLDHQNNYVGNSSTMSDAAKSFDRYSSNLEKVRPTRIIILMVQQNYFQICI